MRFTKTLTDLFETVEQDFETALIARYRKAAKSQYESWLKRLDGDEPPFHCWQARNRPDFVKWVKMPLARASVGGQRCS